MPTQAVADWRGSTTVSVEEAAAILGIGRSSAYALASAGELPALRLGRRYVVPVAALRRMLGEIDPEDTSSPRTTGSAQEVGDGGAQHAS